MIVVLHLVSFSYELQIKTIIDRTLPHRDNKLLSTALLFFMIINMLF